MPELNLFLIVASFIAGLLMFLAPCTLPLVPGYLAFISGVKQNDVETKHSNIYKNALAFVLGFSLVFVLFGVMAGHFGGLLGPLRIWLSQIGGLIIILFGLAMIGFFKLPFLNRSYRLKLPKSVTPGRPHSAFLIGVIFALGWTPCIGPVLATVLLLASDSATALSGGFLLLVFSLGLAIPFMLVALAYSKATNSILKATPVLVVIEMVGGVFLVVLGWLLLTDSFGLLIQYGYRFTNFLGFGNFLDYY